MPPATDGSSVISESRRAGVNSRDGGLCVLCGMNPVDVAHIIARKAGDQGQVDWICNVASSLSNFRKDDALNLICLCPTHHRQYNSGWFVLVPSQQQRVLLLEHERRDFAMRENTLAHGGRDPGRSLPALIDEFEYIPVRDSPFRMHVHNPTPYDPTLLVFDNIDHRPCPLLHFRASHIALMVEAEPYLSTVTRLRSPKGAIAQPQITELLNLYHRQPSQHSNLSTSTSVPSNYVTLSAELEQPNTQPKARILPAVPGSPPSTNAAPAPLMSFTKDGPMPGLSPSILAPTDDGSQADNDLYAGADPQLVEYAKEQSVTWEDLNTRPPLFGGEEQGPWRFASADDIIRAKQL